MELKAQWFTEKGRPFLTNLIKQNQKRQAQQFASFHPFQKSKNDVVYELTIAGAQAAFYEYLRYLLIEPKGQKPWLVKDKIEKPLTLKQFEESLADTILRLQQKGPSVEYASLVHMSAVLNLLTRTEIVKNG